MESLPGLLAGLAEAITPAALAMVFIGVAWGIVAGALPGVTASIGMALILPFTWAMPPHLALMMLAGVYVGAEYGGSIPAILLKMPGEPSNAPAAIDGYAMHLRGESGRALGLSLVPGSVASVLGALALVLLVIPLSQLALTFGPAEFFALAVFGLSAVAGISGRSVVKGLISALFGMALGTIGSDFLSGTERFTFDSVHLLEGLGLVPVIIGLLAVSEAFVEARRSHIPEPHQAKSSPASSGAGRGRPASTRLPSLRDYREVAPATLLGTFIGVVVGVMPGAGAAISSFISYGEARRWSRHPELFGKGAPDGIAAPEAANNAVVGGALVPLLAFGIPGSGSAAIMLAALMLHGLRPGPMLLQNRPDILYAMFGGLLTASIAMLILGLIFMRAWIKVVAINKPALTTAILLLVSAGAYARQGDVFDVLVTFVMGAVGYAMLRSGFSPVAAVLGLVLAELLETNFRRALVISQGDPSIFVTKPTSLVLLILALAVLALPTLSGWLARRRSVEQTPKSIQ